MITLQHANFAGVSVSGGSSTPGGVGESTTTAPKQVSDEQQGASFRFHSIVRTVCVTCLEVHALEELMYSLHIVISYKCGQLL